MVKGEREGREGGGVTATGEKGQGSEDGDE